jgi:hypothetical protein
LFKKDCSAVFAEKTSGFADTTVQKIVDLQEGLEYSDIEDYTRKLGIVMGKVEEKADDKDLDIDKDDLDRKLDDHLDESKKTVKPLASLNKNSVKS